MLALLLISLIGIILPNFGLTLIIFYRNVTITYRIEEEHKQQLIVGDLYHDFKIDHVSDFRNCSVNHHQCQLVFFPSSQLGRKYFRLLSKPDQTKSIYLVAVDRLDREQICTEYRQPSQQSWSRSACVCSYNTDDCHFQLHFTLSPLLDEDRFIVFIARIFLVDTNDNAPVFPQPVIDVVLNLAEFPHCQTYLPNATDSDIGLNRFIFYKYNTNP